MLPYCLKCRKNQTKKPGIIIIESKLAVCDSKKLRFIKEREACGLLRSLGSKTLLNKIPLLDDILFQRCKINEIVIKFLIAGDKFMREMHLRQPGFLTTRIYLLLENSLKTKKECTSLKKHGIQDTFIETN